MSLSDPISTYWLNRDHAEALGIARQLSAAPDGVTSQHIVDLNRACDCFEDGEGYDVPSERMRKLRDVGLVEGGRFGRYSVTELGQRLRALRFDVNATSSSDSEEPK